MEHRGAKGADINTGDGAGLLIQVPDRFYRDVVSFDLPEAGAYATGVAFLPQEPAVADEAAARVEALLVEEGLTILGWRDMPIDQSILGSASLMTMPTFRQVFVVAQDGSTGIELHAVSIADFGEHVAEPFGVGCAPDGNLVPTVEVTSPPTAGGSLSLAFHGLKPSSPALLAVGSRPGHLELGADCYLRVALPFLPVSTVADGSM